MRAREFITETPLPPEAISTLQQYKDALNKPGIQLSGPPDFLAGAQYPELRAQIERLERLMVLFVEFERLANRVEGSRRGVDRGTAADLEIIRNWPTPETDGEVVEFTRKLEQGIQQLKNYIQQKRMIWR